MSDGRARVRADRRGPYGGDDVTRPFWPASRGAFPTHANGMWSGDSAKRRQALYFFAFGLTYVRERKCRHATLPRRRLSCCVHAFHGARERSVRVTWVFVAHTIRGALVWGQARGRQRGLASSFRERSTSSTGSVFMDRVCTYSIHESLGERLRKH